METYYLVDYENVGSEGLKGCDKLQNTDYIIIFFTEKNKKIDMSVISKIGDARLKMIEISSGNQSVDFHLVYFLGYLSGLERTEDCTVKIISKDTDFDKVIKFNNARSKVKASRAQQIAQSLLKTVTDNKKNEKKTVEQNTEVKSTSENKTDTKKLTGPEKNKINNEITRILTDAKIGRDNVGFVTSLVAKKLGKNKSKLQIYQEIISKFGQNKGLEIYNHIKKHI